MLVTIFLLVTKDMCLQKNKPCGAVIPRKPLGRKENIMFNEMDLLISDFFQKADEFIEKNKNNESEVNEKNDKR